MPGGLGPRFALEAGFLILLAVVVGFADLSPALIILVMALAWLLVSLIEYFAWRQGPRFPAARQPYAAAAAAPGAVLEEERVEEIAPPPSPPPAPSPPAEEETAIEPPAAEEEPAAAREETVAEADERVAARRSSFAEDERRTRHRLEPLQPRPKRRWLSFGLRGRAGREVGGPAEGSREEER